MAGLSLGLRGPRRVNLGRSAIVCILLLWLLVLGACTSCGENPIPQSGIRGTVTLGPLNPVSQPGQVDSRPYSATIRVKTIASDRIVATVVSDDQGLFSVPLEPGRYLIEPQNGDPLPVADTQEVTVTAGTYTEISIDYDSGIR